MKFVVCYATTGDDWRADSFHVTRQAANQRAQYIAWRCPDYEQIRVVSSRTWRAGNMRRTCGLHIDRRDKRGWGVRLVCGGLINALESDWF